MKNLIRRIFGRRSRYAAGGVIKPGPKLGDLYRLEDGHVIPVRRAKPSGDLS